MSDEFMAYIGRATCGCIVAATVDDPKHPDWVAKDVAEFIMGGLTIERVPGDIVRTQFGCKHRYVEAEQPSSTQQMQLDFGL